MTDPEVQDMINQSDDTRGLEDCYIEVCAAARAMLAALEEIEESWLPSQPAANPMDSFTWAQFHIAHLRDIARRASVAAKAAGIKAEG